MTKQCEQCGATFETGGAGRYCSDNCKRPLQPCERCGQLFNVGRHRKGATYCSKVCQGVARRGSANANFKGMREVPCAQCGAVKLVYPSRVEDGRVHYCSIECRYDGQRGRIGELSPSWKGRGAKPVACAQCGTLFLRKDAHMGRNGKPSRNQFCSPSCKVKYMVGENAACGIGSAHPRWRGGASTERGVWDQHGGRPWKKDIRRRDAYTCQHCGIVKDSRSRGLHVHHKASFAEYPDLRSVVANGVCVCQACHNWLHSNEGALVRLRWEQDALAELGHLIVERDAAQEA